MKLPVTLCTLALFATSALTAPIEAAIRRHEVDGDDAVVYAWKVPTEGSKVKRHDEVDGDDAVVYAWKVPTEGTKMKRGEEVDGDDAVVYAWKVPTAE